MARPRCCAPGFGWVSWLLSLWVLGSVGQGTACATLSPAEGTAHELGGQGDKVLVLGSGGLVGRAMTRWLEQNNFTVVHVKNRQHIDLRKPGALDQFDDKNVAFVMFLACEVGGSKFIDSSSNDLQLSIVENNMLIYQTVFPWLAKTKIPFIFSSSYLQTQPNAYGSIKRLGESWIRGLGFGHIVRLWNVYGHEAIGIKSHVLADWVSSCLEIGQINCRTDGQEARQFLHVDDTAAALGTIMMHSATMPSLIHVSSGSWTSLTRVAEAIVEHESSCLISYASVKAQARARISPSKSLLNSLWKPKITLAQGIGRLISDYKEDGQRAQEAQQEQAIGE